MCVNAVMEETTTIPANAAVVTFIRAENFQQQDGAGESSPPEETHWGSCDSYAQRSIGCSCYQSYESSPATICKGTKVAVLSPLSDSDLHVPTTSSEKPKDVSETKQALLWELAQQTEGLSDTQRDQLYSLLLSFADIFPENESDLGRTGIVKHRINTNNVMPLRQPPRRLPKHQQEEASLLLQRMLEKQIVEPSTSPWSSPVVLVRKKDGMAHFCIDYRRVNSLTRKDAYPLPRIDDTLDTLAGSRWFSTIDLLSGYWQVEVADDDKEKTAFATRDGLFQFNVLPFGLCNGPATFQRLMDLVLAGLHWSECLVYLDDVIVLGSRGG